MKKILLIILTLQLSSFCLFAQEKPDAKEVEQFRARNSELVALFKEKNFKVAQKVAVEVLALSKKIYGEQGFPTAAAYKNLGDIFWMRKKYKNAVTNFEKSLSIYKKDQKKYANIIIALLESKGTVLAYDKKTKEAEIAFGEHLSFAEQTFGKDNEKILPYLKKQTDFYLYLKNFDKADEMFIRRQVIAENSDGDVKADNMQDRTICYLHQNMGFDEVIERQRKISKSVYLALGKELPKPPASSGKVTRISGGIVNGKAIRLPKPIYFAPMTERVKGKVLVRIVIDKDGKVISADAFCGLSILRESAEKAALSSTFTSTKLNGENVEVSGLILYEYK